MVWKMIFSKNKPVNEMRLDESNHEAESLQRNYWKDRHLRKTDILKLNMSLNNLTIKKTQELFEKQTNFRKRSGFILSW